MVRRYRDVWKLRFYEHRWNAWKRDIPFRLTFKEWCDIWRASGKWEKRGWRKGQYCMARPGDRGAYETGNVIICLAETNRAERNQKYSLKGEDNPAFGKDYWASASSAERKRRSKAISKQQRGKPKSEQMRAALAKTATGRRLINGTWVYP